jgi:hypothetical protein
MMTSGEHGVHVREEDLLHAAPHCRKTALRQIEQLDGKIGIWHEGMGRVSRLFVAFRGARQNRVTDPRLAQGQAEQQAAGTDLDVVRMRADSEHGQWRA